MPWAVVLTADPKDSDVADMAATYTDATDFATIPFTFTRRITLSRSPDLVIMRAAMTAAALAERNLRRRIATAAATLTAFLNP